MTIKRKRIYEIALIACCCVIIALTAYMGINAVQKSMKLNISIPTNPTFLVKVGYNLDGSEDYTYIFCNSELGGGVLVGENATLDGSQLSLSNLTLSGIGATIHFQVINYTTAPEGYNAVKVMAGGENSGISQVSVILSPYSGSGTTYPSTKLSVRAPTQTTSVTIPLNFEWANLYTVTYESDANSNISGGWATPIGVTPGGNIEGKTFGIDGIEGYSVGAKVEGDCEYTYNPKTGALSISEIQSNIIVTAQANPWTYGTYTNDSTKFPDITSKQNGTMNTGKIWEGYTYIQLANHATKQDVNYSSYPSRWIIIGCGDDLTEAFFPTSLTSTFPTITRTDGITTEEKANPNPYERDATGAKTSTKELGSNQILLLSEQTLINDYYDNNGSGNWTSGSTSSLRYDMNNTSSDGMLNKIGLLEIINMNKNYVASPTLYTGWVITDSTSTNRGGAVQDAGTTNDLKTYMFLLGSRYGQVGGTSGATPQEGGYTRSKTCFLAQNFCIEDYLGSYNSYTSFVDLHAHNNDRIFTFGGSSSGYWLRSGDYGGEDQPLRAATYVIPRGDIDYYYVGDSRGGVRPSFVLNLA